MLVYRVNCLINKDDREASMLGIIEWRGETFHEWELSKCRNVSFSTQSSKVNLKLGTANLWFCYWRGGGSSLRVEQSSRDLVDPNKLQIYWCVRVQFLLNKLELIFLFFRSI